MIRIEASAKNQIVRLEMDVNSWHVVGPVKIDPPDFKKQMVGEFMLHGHVFPPECIATPADLVALMESLQRESVISGYKIAQSNLGKLKPFRFPKGAIP